MKRTSPFLPGGLLRWIALLALVLAPCGAAGRLMAIDPWQQLSAAAASHDPAGARTILEALLLDQPTFYAGQFNLGTLLMSSDPQAAAAHLDIATGSPQSALAADAWHNLALLRFHEGRLEDAVGAAQRALTLRPEDAQEQHLFSEMRRVLIVRADEARRTAEEEARKLHLITTALPDGHAQEAYDQHLSAAGGSGGYRFSIGASPAAAPAAVPGAAAPSTSPPQAPPPLPSGLELDGDGRVHGIPLKAATATIPIAVRDSAGTSITATVTLTVIPAPQITTSQLPEAVLGSPYEAALDAVGLDLPLWTIDGLPHGLHLEPAQGASVSISGTPLTAGTVQLKLTAHDAQRHAAKQLTLSISDLFAPEQSVLPPSTAWAAYHHTLTVRGPTQTYQWKAAAQGGITIAADGAVSGAPEKAGALPLAATIIAQDGRHRDVILTLPVNPPPVIDEAKPIELTQGQAVERPLIVTGGTPPYAWHLAEGVLPKGLRLDADGALRGAAAEPGQVVVTAAVADHWLAETQQKITVTVKPSDKKPDQHQKDQKDQNNQDQKNQDQKSQDQKAQQQDQKPGQSGQGQPEKKQEQKPGQGQQGKQQSQQDQKPGQGQQGKQQDQKPGQGQQGQQGKQQDQKPGQAPSAPGTPDAAGSDHGADSKEQGGSAAMAAQDAAGQAHLLNQAAADRWLDQLPKEDRGVLRYQLLEGGEAPPNAKGKPW